MSVGGKRLATWLLTLVTLWLGWVTLLVATQRRMIFPGVGRAAPPPDLQRLAELERFWLSLAGGKAEAWFLPPRGGGPGPALLFTHGNAELIDDWVHAFADFSEHGVGVMLVEYPGYGRSQGTPSSLSLEAAVLAAYDTLARRPQVDPARIVAYGRSVGAGPAAILAVERPLAALVFQSAFTSLRPFARRYLVPPFLVRDRFEVLEAVSSFPGPVLVVHGRADRIIPFAHGEQLARAAPRAALVAYECGHNDCPPDWGEHVRRVVAFLEEEGLLP